MLTDRAPRSLSAAPLAMAALLLCAALPASAAPTNAAAAEARVEYSESDPSPTGKLRVARPMIAWRVVPLNGSRVTKVTLTLNGEPVPARYDEARGAAVYTPDAPLRPGPYAVRCTVVFDGALSADREWRFAIAPDAAPTPPAPAPTQEEICAAVNAVRRTLGLPDLTIDPRLCAAASAHSGYLSVNDTDGHAQEAGRAGFVAATTDDRVGAFGYAGECYESISRGVSAATAAVRGLFDAPYHRVPFLRPGAGEIGAGRSRDVVTLLFGGAEASGVVVYPGDGQKDVPTLWDGNESPDPLRLHGPAAKAPTGYVVTLFAFGPDDPRLSVASATLTTADGRPVPVWLNTPDNDEHLPNGVMLIPKRPLAPSMVYRVAVRATDDLGNDRSRTWTFTTAAAPKKPSPPVPLSRKR